MAEKGTLQTVSWGREGEIYRATQTRRGLDAAMDWLSDHPTVESAIILAATAALIVLTLLVLVT